MLEQIIHIAAAYAHNDADRNARNQLKKQLIINHLTFEIMTDVYDFYGDCVPVNCVFEIDRVSGWLHLHQEGETQQRRIKNASKTLPLAGSYP